MCACQIDREREKERGGGYSSSSEWPKYVNIVTYDHTPLSSGEEILFIVPVEIAAMNEGERESEIK